MCAGVEAIKGKGRSAKSVHVNQRVSQCYVQVGHAAPRHAQARIHTRSSQAVQRGWGGGGEGEGGVSLLWVGLDERQNIQQT